MNMKFAAIDIGSNGVRLLLSQVFEYEDAPVIKKECLVRMPIRLGDNVFRGEAIPANKVDSLIKAMTGFRCLIESYCALDHAAFATSAMREAVNGPEIIAAIREKSGIDIEVIDGRREAEIIFSFHLSKFPWSEQPCLYIDVGGGSTEITFFDGQKSMDSGSFDIGTIRILQDLVTPDKRQILKNWLKKTTAKLKPAVAVGSGGNINKVFRLSRQKENKPISRKIIKDIRNNLDSYTLDERIRDLRLRPDRADVIVPAMDIFLMVMKWSGIKNLYVPQAGLSDGAIRVLYDRYKARNSAA